jgi:predicted transcriptional regulator
MLENMAADSKINLEMRAKEIIAIKEGLADVDAGRTVPWEQGLRELRQVRAAKRRALASLGPRNKLAA